MPENPFDADQKPSREDERNRERWDERLQLSSGYSTVKRKHHFVPQAWLKNWAEPGSDQVYVSDLSGEEIRGFVTNTANAMVRTDLYRSGLEDEGRDYGPEDHFAAIEGAAAGAIRSLIEGESLDSIARYDLSLFLAVQHARTPNRIAELVPPDPSGIGALVDDAISRRLALPDEPDPAVSGRRSHSVAAELDRGRDGALAFERVTGFWNLLFHAHDLAAAISRRQWSVLTAHKLLLISDDPVPRAPLGGVTLKVIDQTWTCDTPVPLGRHTLLLIGNRADGSSVVPSDEAERYFAVSNEIQAHAAQRFFVSPIPPDANQ